MKQIKAVLFDLGSTLVYFQGNWDQVVYEAIQQMCEKIIGFGVPIEPDRLINDYTFALQNYYIERDFANVERTTLTLLDELLKKTYQVHLSALQLKKALDTFYEHTGSHWKLDDESLPTLQILKDQGYRLGLISNASYSRDVMNQLEKNSLTPYFEQILVSADVGFRKPHANIFNLALSYFQVEPAETVMIGDTLNADIIGSRRMGMRNIWISRWASAPTTHYRDDMIVPDRTIQRLSQIPSILMNW